jgi:lysozyme
MMAEWQINLRDQLKRHEGWVPHAYQDHLGFWTIGYGRLIDKNRGGRITLMEGEMLLDNDINRVVDELRRRLPWFERLPERKKQALANMAFQMGVHGLLQFKRTLAAVELGQYKDAQKHALESKWARQTPARAQEVAQMLGE